MEDTDTDMVSLAEVDGDSDREALSLLEPDALPEPEVDVE